MYIIDTLDEHEWSWSSVVILEKFFCEVKLQIWEWLRCYCFCLFVCCLLLLLYIWGGIFINFYQHCLALSLIVISAKVPGAKAISTTELVSGISASSSALSLMSVHTAPKQHSPQTTQLPNNTAPQTTPPMPAKCWLHQFGGFCSCRLVLTSVDIQFLNAEAKLKVQRQTCVGNLLLNQWRVPPSLFLVIVNKLVLDVVKRHVICNQLNCFKSVEIAHERASTMVLLPPLKSYVILL